LTSFIKKRNEYYNQFSRKSNSISNRNFIDEEKSLINGNENKISNFGLKIEKRGGSKSYFRSLSNYVDNVKAEEVRKEQKKERERERFQKRMEKKLKQLKKNYLREFSSLAIHHPQSRVPIGKDTPFLPLSGASPLDRRRRCFSASISFFAYRAHPNQG